MNTSMSLKDVVDRLSSILAQCPAESYALSVSRPDLEAILMHLKMPMVFYYEQGSQRSYKEIVEAAKAASSHNVFVFPRTREFGGPGVSKGICLKCAKELSLEGAVPADDVIVYFEEGNLSSFKEAQQASSGIPNVVFVPRRREAGGIGVSMGTCIKCAQSLSQQQESVSGNLSLETVRRVKIYRGVLPSVSLPPEGVPVRDADDNRIGTLSDLQQEGKYVTGLVTLDSPDAIEHRLMSTQIRPAEDGKFKVESLSFLGYRSGYAERVRRNLQSGLDKHASDVERAKSLSSHQQEPAANSGVTVFQSPSDQAIKTYLAAMKALAGHDAHLYYEIWPSGTTFVWLQYKKTQIDDGESISEWINTLLKSSGLYFMPYKDESTDHVIVGIVFDVRQNGMSEEAMRFAFEIGKPIVADDPKSIYVKGSKDAIERCDDS